MQIKRPKMSPAVALIGKITADALAATLRYLDLLSAGRWEIARVGLSKSDGAFFVVRYWPTNRPGTWEAVFGFDGSCWAD